MRPRPDAAENLDVDDDGFPGDLLASMRPRPDAAENLAHLDDTPEHLAALQ